MIYYGTEFVDKPTFNESMSDIDCLRYIHYRLTELGDYSHYSHVSRLIVVADAIQRLQAENEKLEAAFLAEHQAAVDQFGIAEVLRAENERLEDALRAIRGALQQLAEPESGDIAKDYEVGQIALPNASHQTAPTGNRSVQLRRIMTSI